MLQTDKIDEEQTTFKNPRTDIERKPNSPLNSTLQSGQRIRVSQPPLASSLISPSEPVTKYKCHSLAYWAPSNSTCTRLILVSLISPVILAAYFEPQSGRIHKVRRGTDSSPPSCRRQVGTHAFHVPITNTLRNPTAHCQFCTRTWSPAARRMMSKSSHSVSSTRFATSFSLTERSGLNSIFSCRARSSSTVLFCGEAVTFGSRLSSDDSSNSFGKNWLTINLFFRSGCASTVQNADLMCSFLHCTDHVFRKIRRSKRKHVILFSQRALQQGIST